MRSALIEWFPTCLENLERHTKQPRTADGRKVSKIMLPTFKDIKNGENSERFIEVGLFCVRTLFCGFKSRLQAHIFRPQFVFSISVNSSARRAALILCICTRVSRRWAQRRNFSSIDTRIMSIGRLSRQARQQAANMSTIFLRKNLLQHTEQSVRLLIRLCTETLKLGTKYTRELMPRIITAWLDTTTSPPKPEFPRIDETPQDATGVSDRKRRIKRCGSIVRQKCAFFFSSSPTLITVCRAKRSTSRFRCSSLVFQNSAAAI